MWSKGWREGDEIVPDKSLPAESLRLMSADEMWAHFEGVMQRMLPRVDRWVTFQDILDGLWPPQRRGASSGESWRDEVETVSLRKAG